MKKKESGMKNISTGDYVVVVKRNGEPDVSDDHDYPIGSVQKIHRIGPASNIGQRTLVVEDGHESLYDSEVTLATKLVRLLYEQTRKV